MLKPRITRTVTGWWVILPRPTVDPTSERYAPAKSWRDALKIAEQWWEGRSSGAS